MGRTGFKSPEFGPDLGVLDQTGSRLRREEVGFWAGRGIGSKKFDNGSNMGVVVGWWRNPRAAEGGAWVNGFM